MSSEHCPVCGEGYPEGRPEVADIRRARALSEALLELKRQDQDAYIAGGEWHQPFHTALDRVLDLVPEEK